MKQKQKTKKTRVFPNVRNVKRFHTLYSSRRKLAFYFAKITKKKLRIFGKSWNRLESKFDKNFVKLEKRFYKRLERVGEQLLFVLTYILNERVQLDPEEKKKITKLYRREKKNLKKQLGVIQENLGPYVTALSEVSAKIIFEEKKIIQKSLNSIGDRLLYVLRVLVWYKRQLKKDFRPQRIHSQFKVLSYDTKTFFKKRFGNWEPFVWEVEINTEKISYILSPLFLASQKILELLHWIWKKLEAIDIEIQIPKVYRLALQKSTVVVLNIAIVFSLIGSLYLPQSPLSNVPPVLADVGHDTTSEFPSASTTGCTVSPCSYTHTPSGTPRGVLIFVYTVLQTADVVTGVTYGGTSVPAVSGGSATDTATEPGRVTAYFLGSSVPTGAQTVSVTKSSAAVSIYINTITITSSAPYNLETTGVVLQQENGALAQSSVNDGSPGTNSMRFAGCYSGATTISAGAASTLLQSMAISTTAFAASVRETTAGQGARNVGCTSGNDDRAGVALAVREVSTTLGDGTDSTAAPTIGPDGAQTEIDRFSLVTTTGTDTVTGLTVTLGPANAFNNVATVEVKTTGGVSKCSESSIASNSVALTSCAIAVTTSSTEYVVYVTPKTHANMPAVPGASYATTATVTSTTASNNANGTDTDSDTVTIDNASPADVTSSSVSAGDTQNSLSWTNPVDSDFDSVIVLRRATSAVADVPVEGASYSVGNTIGTATVACVTASTSCTDTSLNNGTAYHYKIFSKDSRGNYAAGVVPSGSPATPELSLITTIATGTDPASATIAPESAITDAGQFTLVVTSGTDSVTALTVTLAGSGTPYDGVSEVRITSSDNNTLYFAAISNPSSNTLNFSGGTPIPVDTGADTFKIRITPKTHANMAAVPGASYALSPYVSAFTSTNAQAGSDSNANTLTIDNTSPADATSATVSAGDTQNSLSWTNPVDSDFSQVVVLRRATSAVSSTPVEGTTYIVGDNIGTATVACVTSSTSCTDTGLTNGTAYHYKIYAKDTRGNYSQTGIVPSGSPATPFSTTTIANGTNPSNATVAPESGITDLDAFTFAVGSGTDSVTALTVTLASGTYAGISEVRITSDDGSILYFAAVSNPSSETVNFSGGTPIPVDTGADTFKIRITPKTHANMAVPPGASYAVTGTVTAFTSTNAQAGTDSGSATITIDNLSPNGATSTSGSGGDANNTINWTTSNSSDFNTTSGSVLLRWAAATPGAEVPAEGATYTAGDAIGTATVACVISSAASTAQSKVDGTSGSSGCNTSALTNSQAYSYAIFQKDTRGNYDAGTTITGSPFTPTLTPRTTIANGTNPSNATVAPSTSAVELDSFTFATNTGTDSVTALTVTLANNTFNGISEIKVTSDDGATLYFAAVSDPAANAVNFSGGTPIPVTTSATQFKVIITPKTHANMAVPPGASYATTGTVTAFTSTNAQQGTDSGSATITIDNLSTANPAPSATPDDQQVTLDWTNPVDSDYDTTIILKNTASITDAPTEGSAAPSQGSTIGSSTVLYVGTGITLNDTGLSNGTTYYYKFFGRDTNGNYSTGSQVSATPSLTPTSIIANGTDPANATVEPGTADTVIDAFTLRTNTGTDTVTDITVTSANTTAIASMKIFSNDLLTQYFTTVTVPTGDAWAFSGGTTIDLTTSATTYKIVVTFKSHAVLASGSYAVTARVTSFTATNPTAGSDSASATITVDNLAAADVTAASGTAGDTDNSLSWTNPVDSDFSTVVVLRRASSAVADAPTDGSSYSVGNTIGSSTVACVTATTSCTDTSLSNGTAYHYKIFSKDTRNNYSSGVVPTGSPLTPTLTPRTTIANGTNPGNSTVAPETSITDLNAFTFQTNTGTDSITALTVTLANGTYAGIADIRITSDDGSTLYFAAAANPSANAVNFSGGTPIPATTSATQFKVRITPKTHANMPVPPGASYATTGTVTSFTSTNAQAGTDSGSATITIDNGSPGNASWGTITVSDSEIILNWTNPADSDFSEVVILRSGSSITAAPTEGQTYAASETIGGTLVVYAGSLETFTDTISNNTNYYYKIFSKDTTGNYSVGSQTGAHIYSDAPPSGGGGGLPPSGIYPPAPLPPPAPVIEEPKVTPPPAPTKPKPVVVRPAPTPAPTPSPIPQPIIRPSPAPAPVIDQVTKPKISLPRISLPKISLWTPIKNLADRTGDKISQSFDSATNFITKTSNGIGKASISFYDFCKDQVYKAQTTLVAFLQSIKDAVDYGARVAVNTAKSIQQSAMGAISFGQKFAYGATNSIGKAFSATIRFANDAWDKTLKLATPKPKQITVDEEKEVTQTESVVFRSGELELIASQDQPIQSIVGFNFVAEIKPSKEADSIGGTFKFTDSDGDGIWTASVRMPEIPGIFKFDTKIAYVDGRSRDIKSDVLIDPEGYVYEQHRRGELRIENAKVTLWQNVDGRWEIWPARKYNQINPQITNKTGDYSFLAPAGEYYLEALATDYELYKSEVFNLTQTNPIHQSIELKYTGN